MAGWPMTCDVCNSQTSNEDGEDGESDDLAVELTAELNFDTEQAMADLDELEEKLTSLQILAEDVSNTLEDISR